MSDAATTQVYLTTRAAIHRLIEVGLVHGLDDATIDRLRAECWDGDEEQMEDAGLLGVLTSFYETLERGRADGFYWRDDQFWNQTDDAVVELAALLPGAPIFVQRSMGERLSSHDGVKEEVHLVELQRDDGAEEQLEVRSLDDLVARFNAELKARGVPQRIVPLDTSGEWRMYVGMDLIQARQLAREGALPVDDMAPLID